MKKLLAVLLCVVMVFTFAACGNSSDDGAQAGGEAIFNVAATIELDTLNPYSSELALVYDMHHLVYDSLIAYDEEYNAVPKVAASWENDGFDWIFHLRDDVYFSDGEQLTSADVKFTYETMGDSYLYSIKVAGIDSIECPDDFTVVFHCSQGKPDMLLQTLPILPEHVWSQVEDYMTYETEDIVGSGPFIYSAERSGPGYTAFVRNDNYWDTKANIDVAVFSVYDTYDTMAQALTIGEVDACYEMDASVEATLSAAEGIDAQAFDQLCLEYMGMNCWDELLSDKTIRYAIDYCYDPAQTIEMAYYGLGREAYGSVNNDGYEYIPTDNKRGFNIDKANEILDAAGYVDTDGDGIREKDGKPLSFTLTTASERWSWQSGCVNSIITNCAKAGIEIVSETMGKYAMWDTCYDGATDWQLFMDGWGGDPDPCYMLSTFLDPEGGVGCACANYANPEFDKYFDLGNVELDHDKRVEYLNKAQEILYNDCPYVFLEYTAAFQAINSNKWTGYTANSRGWFQNDRNNTFIDIKLK